MPMTLADHIALVHARAAVLSARCADHDGAENPSIALIAGISNAQTNLDIAERDLDAALACTDDDAAREAARALDAEIAKRAAGGDGT